MNGKTILSLKSKNTNTIELQIPNNIQSGIYLLVTSSNGKIINSTKIINR